MIKKRVLNDKRIRGINSGFSFIPHRFLAEGFLAALDQHQLLLYFFLVLASDRYGLSYYAYDSICTATRLTVEQYIDARNSLIKKDLIAFDGTLFQVLQLPLKPPAAMATKASAICFVQQLAKQVGKEICDEN